MSHTLTHTPTLADYLALSKPRVVLLMLLCTLVGMLLATKNAVITWELLIANLIGVALIAGSSATLNHILDIDFDVKMQRTKGRPLVKSDLPMPVNHAIFFSIGTAILGTGILLYFVNPLTTALNLFAWFGYGIFYTIYLKHATSQNIVIGGIFGAMPPLFGWTAVTNQISPESLLLVAIIFAWTPPHFWALALHKKSDYLAVAIPMLPITHGDEYTRLHILLYSLLLLATTLMPFAIGMSGIVYLTAAILLNTYFLHLAVKLWLYACNKTPIKLFLYSITYLALLFLALLLDSFFYIPTI